MPHLLNTLMPDATSMIRMDHTHALAIFHRYKASSSASAKASIAKTLCAALEIHAQLEEDIFYPALQRVLPGSDEMRKSVPEHDAMRRLIARLRSLEPGTVEHDDIVLALMREVLHHVADEETVLLPAAERLLPDQLGELGARMTRRRLELVGPRIGEIALHSARAMPVATLLALGTAAGLGAWAVHASRRMAA